MFIIIDDEEVNLFLSEMVITQALGPQTIKTFTSAGGALRFLKETFQGKWNEPAIVLLDLNMPVLSGWDFLEFFDQFDSELKNNVYIYIVSSSVDPKDKDKALLNPNVMAFLAKPLTTSFIAEHFKTNQPDLKRNKKG